MVLASERSSQLKRWAALVIAALAVGAAAYFLLVPRERMAPIVPELEKAAQEKAASLLREGAAERADLNSAEGRERAQEWFLKAVPEDAAAALDDEALRSAFATLYQFAGALGAESPGAYAEWARSRDHALRDRWPKVAGRGEGSYREVYEFITGEDAPADFGPGSLFHRLFRARANTERASPVAMMLGGQILDVDYLEFTHHADIFDYRSASYAREGLGMDFWHGGSSGMGIRLWDPPRSVEEIIEYAGAAPRRTCSIRASVRWGGFYDPHRRARARPRPPPVAHPQALAEQYEDGDAQEIPCARLLTGPSANRGPPPRAGVSFTPMTRAHDPLPSQQHRYDGLPALSESRLHERRERVFLIFAGIFLGSLAMLNILGITRFLNLAWFIEGSDEWRYKIAVAVGVLPYPITFLCTDFISELYGRRRANRVVAVGFLINLWVVFVLWLGGAWPGFEATTRRRARSRATPRGDCPSSSRCGRSPSAPWRRR